MSSFLRCEHCTRSSNDNLKAASMLAAEEYNQIKVEDGSAWQELLEFGQVASNVAKEGYRPFGERGTHHSCSVAKNQPLTQQMEPDSFQTASFINGTMAVNGLSVDDVSKRINSSLAHVSTEFRQKAKHQTAQLASERSELEATIMC